MNNIEEFLEKSKRATNALFTGISNYDDLIQKREAPPSVFSGSDFAKQYEEYCEANKEAIQHDSERDIVFLTEWFALATLCGAVLQFAHQAIGLYSQNVTIPDITVCSNVTKDSVRKFCIGRNVRGVPLGLAIYAGRNQHVHLQESISSLNQTILRELVENGSQGGGSRWIIGSEFEYIEGNAESMAPHFIDLFEWNKLEAFERDMVDALGDVV